MYRLRLFPIAAMLKVAHLLLGRLTSSAPPDPPIHSFSDGFYQQHNKGTTRWSSKRPPKGFKMQYAMLD